MKHNHHDHWLFVIICVIGIVSLLVMGGVNVYIDNGHLGWGEVAIGVVGIVNLIFYLKNRNLDRASHVVLSSTLLLLSAIMIDGGIKETGWMWIFLYPTIAFALRSVATASWYVSLFGIYIAGLTIGELLGFNLSVYGRTGLIQLCASYGVLSAMLSFTERAHERIARDNERQREELTHEKSLLWQQRDQLRVFKTAVEQSGEMMIFTDPEGNVLWANKATEEVTGFSIEEVVGKKAGLLWGKLMDSEYYQKLWQTIKQDKKMFVSEIQNHRKSGDHFYSTITIYPLLDKSGEVQYFVATQQDITEQKEIDQMKTDFVSLVSHQLRTPLSAMRWNLEMLLAGDIGKISAKQKEVIGQVAEANARMVKLISTLLNISRIESGRLIVDPEEIVITELIKKMMKSAQSNIKGQKIVLDLPKNTMKVRVDPMLLRQILNNFVNNASKYSPKDKEIKITFSVNKDKYTIAVEDKGYGIPIAEQRKIFGKFFRASNISQHDTDGTGMGLYIGGMVAKLLGGKIGFSSTEGQGSVFWVTLPIEGIAAKAGEVRLI